MKKWLPFTLILASLPLAAGVRIQMEDTDLSDNSTTPSEILIDATRFRVNLPDTSMMFVNENGGKIMVLNKERNEVRVVDKATMERMSNALNGAMAQLQEQMAKMPPEQRAMMERMMKGKMKGMLGAAGAPAAEPVRTEYTNTGDATVNGFSCTNYQGTRQGQVVADVCATDPANLHLTTAEFAVFDDMRNFVKSLTDALAKSPMGAMAGAFTNPIADQGFQGFPVERYTYEDGKRVRRDAVTSVEEASFTDTDFSFGDAKQVDLIPPGSIPGQ